MFISKSITKLVTDSHSWGVTQQAMNSSRLKKKFYLKKNFKTMIKICPLISTKSDYERTMPLYF